VLFPLEGGVEDWEAGARCSDVDPALFFGPNRFEPKRERLAREAAAKEICATCPALEPCRARSLREAEQFGVWGGLGESERRAILATPAAARKAG
jgi:WhiB family transcriptional regulator, redox-sensing transcriptional regulator